VQPSFAWEQDIRLSEVVQRMAEMERQLTQEMAPFWVLKVCYTQELLMQLQCC